MSDVKNTSASALDLFAQLFDEVAKGEERLTKAEFAARYFLNPQMPLAAQDDPDGSFHFDQGISTPEGEPVKGLRRDQPIELRMRWYQQDMLDDDARFRVYRMGRRTGKSFCLGLEAVVTALMNPNAKILVLAPNESHVKVLFDEYIRPLLSTYRHKKSGRIGIPVELSGKVPDGCDFAIPRNTQKPHEIVITDGKRHNVTIRGMVISNAARGQSANLLIFDEADYADTEKVQGIVTPIINTRPDTRIVMSSTPTGRRDSFYYSACHDSMWSQHHHTFKVLPHYNEKVHALTAKLAGGENSNTFAQEYLADFGTQTSGVFDQAALNKAFYVAPYAEVLERTEPRTLERRPLLAGDRTTGQVRAYHEAVRPFEHAVGGPGASSLYRPEYRGKGIVTLGTDWNKAAGMQTVAIWWPPKEMLASGEIRVSRFDYEGSEAITTSRSKAGGEPVEYVVGSDNGDPGGIHDLSHVEGIVIWHGRLESGDFIWSAAANRVVGIMSIPDFADTWYVDYGYGEQVTEMIKGILTSGEYLFDDRLVKQAHPVGDRAIRHARAFHPENDPERTGKRFRTVRFGDVYEGTDIDFLKRDDRYKDAMVALTSRAVAERKILLPYGELAGYHKPEQMGSHYTSDGEARPETDRDLIEDNGGAPRRDGDFGGLITQMREWRVDGVSPTGRPRYAGIDHAIDALMLSVLAYYENHAESGPGNANRPGGPMAARVAEDVLAKSAAIGGARPDAPKATTQRHGSFDMKAYKSERAPIDAMLRGQLSPKNAGTSLAGMLAAARKQLGKR